MRQAHSRQEWSLSLYETRGINLDVIGTLSELHAVELSGVQVKVIQALMERPQT